MQPEHGGNTKGETASQGTDGRAYLHHRTAGGGGKEADFKAGHSLENWKLTSPVGGFGTCFCSFWFSVFSKFSTVMSFKIYLFFFSYKINIWDKKTNTSCLHN